MQPFSFSAIARSWTVQFWLFLGDARNVSASIERTASLMANQTKKKGQANGQQNGNGQGDRKPPVKEFRLGAVRASIWLNQGQQGPWYSVTLSRRYLQGTEWKTASSYGRDNLFQVAEVCRLSAVWCYENPANKQGDDSDPQPENGQPDEPTHF